MNLGFRDSREVYDRFEEFNTRNFCKLGGSLSGDGLQVRSRIHTVEEFMVGRCATVAGWGHLRRTPAEINAAPRRRFALYIPIRGELEISQFSRTVVMKPGNFALISLDEPFTKRKSGNNDTVCVLLPCGFVDQRLIRSDDLCARPVSVESGIRRLAHENFLALERNAGDMTAAELDRSIRLAGNLGIAALDGLTDADSNIKSVSDAAYARAQRIIRTRLSDCELTIEDVARECGVSLRSLHRLFSSHGNTVARHLKQQRLQRARHMLEQAGQSTTITDISLSCGFSNFSQFSTAFRKAFALPPRDVMRRPAAFRDRADPEPQ